MGRKVIIRLILVLGLTVVSLVVLFGLLAGTQEQVYAASSQPTSGEPSARLVPPPGPARAPAASPPLAPLFNGSGTPVITVCSSCPITTVQAAVTAIPSGGIVKVAQGTFTDTDGSDGVVYITKSLTLQGGYTITNWSTFDPATYPTILDGEGANRVILVAINVSPTIEGFHIVNGSPTSGCGGGVYIGGGATLRRNRIYDNAANDIGGGVCVFGGSPILENNFIYTNTAANRGGGIYIAAGAPLLHHNTLYDNLASGNGGGIYVAAGAPIISATIVVSNTASDGGGIYGAGGLLDYNDVWGNSGGEYGGGATAGSNSISDDPRFVDPPGLNLRLQAGSPCRDQVPSAQMAEADYWGLVRPFGEQADIGAHEFYAGDCFARIGNSQVYSTAQAAIDVADTDDLVKVAGYCAGVDARAGFSQTAYISQPLTLRGGYTLTNWSDPDPDVYTTTLDAQEQGRVIYIASGISPIVEGLHIVGGDAGEGGGSDVGGGIYNSSGSPTLRNNLVYNNTAGLGGGIYNGSGSPTIQGNAIYNNTSKNDDGGGIYVAGGGGNIQSNWIYANTANRGGGIYASNGSSDIQSNWIYANTAVRTGGGIYVFDGNSNILDNWIYDNYIAGLHENYGGGGIYAAGGTIRGNHIYSNNVGLNRGGGIRVEADNIVVEQNDIHHNDARFGGGIHSRFSIPIVRNNLVRANTATESGGGIYFIKGGVVDGNTIYGNSAGLSGGGGGVCTGNEGGNSATVRNNIIVSNTRYGIWGLDPLTVSYSDVWGNTDGNYSGSAVAGTGTITANPQFVNPGVDFHLQSGSLSIDAADPDNYPSADYAGYARPFGLRADMGAYEFYAGTCFAQIEGATRVYTTVQTAVDTATVGSLVKVAGFCQGAQPRSVGSETFTQTVYISKSLTLRGGYTVTNWTTPTAQTILDAVGQGRAVYVTGTGAVTVDGFIVRGGNAITGGGLYVAVPLSPTVQNIIFYSNTAQYGGGLASTGGNPRLYNNTFVTNTATVTGGGVYLADGSPVISNTIVVSNAGGGIWAGSGASLSLAYNDVWENAGGGYVGSATAGTTDFAADPRFVNFGGRDFHLNLDSPCVHTADPGTALAWDLEGDARPLGRGADIGADESALYADVRFAPFSWLGGIPDQPTVHTHFLTNTGSISDTFDLTHTLIVSDSTGWVVNYTLAFALVASEVTEAPVTVVVPDTAISGTMATVVLTATSRANSDIYAVVSNTTMVNWNPGVELTPAYTEHVNAGTVITYVHTLTNTGNAPDSFSLAGFSSSYGWAKEVTPTQIVGLGAQVTATVWVRVEVPSTTPGGLIETTVITAVSPSSGARAAVTDTTQVNYTTGDRYVAQTGDDALNNCLISGAPCRTIDHAVDQAVSGDTVKVAEGAYDENNITLNKDITLLGGYYAGWLFDPVNHPTIVDAQGAGRVFYIFGSPTIEGFTIKGGATAGSGGGIYIYSLGSPIIQGNVITGNTAGIYGGGIHNELGSATVERNVLAYNAASRGGGFSSADGSPSFWNNMVYDNAASAKGGGVYVAGGSARIWHDTIYNNTADQGGGVYLAGGSPVVSNTIVVRNTATITGGGIYSQAAGAALDFNDVWGNTNANYVGATAGPNSISADPDFVNEAARDLHLYSSPCEDAGDATSAAEDYDEQPRTMGSAPDMGADERRRLGVELEPDGAKSGNPGTQITYNHVVTNAGNYTDTFALTASSSHGWTAASLPASVEVGPGQSEGIQVWVTIPDSAVWNLEDRVIVTATSGINPTISDTAVDTTTVNLRCGVSWAGYLDLWHRSGADTDVGVWQVLENEGNYTETFDISWSWSADAWPVVVSPDPATLGPGESRTIWFTVTVPAGSSLMVNQLTITATATANCSDVTDPPAVHTFVINQDPGLTLESDESGTDLPGQTVTYEHLLTNTGNYYDNTIWLTWRTNPSWSVTVNGETEQPVAVGLPQSPPMTVTVDVTIPEAATCGMSNTTIITAASWAGYYAPAYQIVRVSVTDTTSVQTVYNVEFTPDRVGNVSSDPTQPVTATYTHGLTNTGNCPQQFGFLSQSSQGFTVTAPASVSLNPGDSTEVSIYVTMPPTTTSDLLVDTTVITAYHTAGIELAKSAVVDTTIVNQVAGVALGPDNTGVITQPSSTDIQIQYTHTLTNSGNYTDTFDLTWLNEDGWQVAVNGQINQPTEVTVGSNLATIITVEVTVPWSVYTITERTVITAASQFSPTVTASAVDTTTVRRPGVTLWPDYVQNVAPGDVITHVHALTNTGGVSDSYVITYHSSLGWAVVTPTVVYTLSPGSWAPILATISVPTSADILSGTADALLITATSQITAVVYDTAVDTTTAPYVPGATITPDFNGQGQAGVPVPYTHTLTNLGNYTESFHLQVWSEFANASVNPEWVIDLGPGEAFTQVIVTVLLPAHAAAGETEETQVLVSFADERVVAHDYTLVTAINGTRYVAPEGTDDNNSCLVPYEYGPCATVQQAVGQALAGDEARVAQGVYTDVHATGGYTQVVYLDKNLALLGGYVNGDWGASPDPSTNQTALDAAGQGRVIYVAAGVTATIEGFHLRQGYVAGDGAGLYVAAGAAPTVRRNFIYSNTAAGSGGEGGGVYYHYTGGDGDLVIERNVVYSNTAEVGGGFYVYGSYGPGGKQNVWNNAIYRNVADNGGGLYLAGDSALVWNNTFYSNTATNGGGVYLYAGSSAISNTIFASNASHGIYMEDGQSGTPALDYNLVWANSPANFYNVSPGSNTITTTPGFVDPVGGDLHLRSNSNALDQGDPNGTLPDVDLDGNRRPLPTGGRHDIGAYENGLTSEKLALEYAPAGGTLTYTIAVTNSGDAPRDVLVTDRLHDYLAYAGQSSTPAADSSGYSDHTVSWQGTIYSNTTAYITITATITDWLVAGTPITNVAQINYVPGSVVTTVVTGTPGTRYVAEIGDDTGSNCLRPDLPCHTIQYAVNQALANDEVQVASGAYTGAGQVAYVSKDLTLTGGYTPTLPTWTYDPDAYTTTLNAQGGQGVVITGSVTGTVAGFHIVNGTNGVDVSTATAVISRCRIYNNTSDGIHAVGGALTLARSWVYSNSDDGVDVDGGAYTLINNVLAHNTGAGVRTTGSSGSLLHNTFARNTAAGAVISNTARFTNTIFYSHSVGVNVAASSSAYLSNTLWYSNTANQGAIVSSANLFDDDPLFENPDGMDYHIQPGSSVIDKGWDTWLSEDIDGDERPLLQHPDLGGDEFALVIVKYAPSTADPGQVITYSIMLQGGESGLVLTDTLDAYLEHVGTVTCTIGDCGYLAAQRAITWTGDLPGAQPAYITYTVQITAWLGAGEQILNDAQVLIAGDVHNTNQVATTINSVNGARHVDAATGADTDTGAGNNCLAQWKPCATVQYAVDQAQASDTVKVAAETYTGSGQVVSISKPLTLVGGYTTVDWNTSDPEANPTYLDGQGSGRAVVVTGPATVMVDGFHLLNGSVSDDGGGLYVNAATVTLANSRVYNNVTSGSGRQGGGIYAASGDLTITATQVYSNASNDSTGGGIYYYDGAFTLVNSQVYSNAASSGGGLYLDNADVVLTDNRIYTNTANSHGGGLRAYDANNVLVERNVILDNQAANGGGVSIDLTSTARITMTNNIVGFNRASSGGGGLLFDGLGSGLLRHNTIADNDGAGVQVGNFNLGLTNTILSGHTVGVTTSHSSASVTADYTLLDGNGTDYDNSGGGAISASNDVIGPPNYRDQTALDYHITGSSAAAGAGTDVGVNTDIDGENRSSPPDIGADQYNLRVDRWASSAEAAPCQAVTHTLVLTNVADSLISGVVLTDALPAEVTYNTGSLTYTAGSGGYLAGSQAITWTGDVAAQSSVYITYSVNVNPYLADGTAVTFTASISDPVSAFPGNPLLVTVRTITATTSKEGAGGVSPAGEATIGELVTYTVVYTVPGGHKTYDPVVVDQLPRLVGSGGVSTTPALAYVPGSLSVTGAATQTEELSTDGGAITWTLNAMTATCGVPAVATLTFNGRVLDLADNDDGDTLTDTVAISYTEGSPAGPGRLIGDDQVLALVEPGLTLAHTAAVTQDLGMGDLVVITVTVTNPGNTTLYDAVLTDTLGSGWVVNDTAGSVLTRTLGGIAAGSSVPVTFTARVNDGVGAAAALVATAEAVGTSLPGVESYERTYTDTAQATVTTGYPDLVVNKSGPTVGVPGQTITYTIAYTNAGVVRAEGVQITDTLPLSLTNIVSAASAGATVERVGQTITWTLTLPVSRSVGGNIWVTGTIASVARSGDVLLNTAGVAATATAEQVMGNNSDFITTTVVEPQAAITKTMSPITGLGTGDEVTVTLTISNPGVSTLYDIVVTDTLPTELNFQSATPAYGHAGAVITWTLGSLNAGQQQGYTVTALVAGDVGANATLTNRAEVMGTSQAGVVSEERVYTDTAQATVTTGYPDLVVSKSGPAVRSPNQSILYTIGYTNTGVVRAEGVRISDALPFSLTNVISVASAGATVEHVGLAITWTLTAPVSRSVSGQIWITATVAAAAVEGSVLTNSVGITTTTAEPNAANNTASLTTTVRLPALSTTKTASPAEPLTAQLLTYTLAISNTGLGDATDLLISDTVPLSTTYQGCSGGDYCGNGSGVVTWTLATLPAGQQTTVAFTVLVDSDAYSGTTLVNQTYGVTCAQGAVSAGAPLSSTVPLWQELSLEPSIQERSILPGEQVIYTHTLVNWGTVVAPTVSVTVSNAPLDWTYTLQPTQVVSLGVGTGAGRLVTLTVQSPSGTGQAVAVITATWQGAPSVYATAVDTTTIGCAPVSGVSIAYTPSAPRIGQTVVFTGTASGAGPLSYSWDFGDSSGDTGAVVTHVYGSDDSYTVQLTVTNCGGAFNASAQRTVVVNPYSIYLPLVLRN